MGLDKKKKTVMLRGLVSMILCDWVGIQIKIWIYQTFDVVSKGG